MAVRRAQQDRLVRENVRIARRSLALLPIALQQLKELTKSFKFSLALGDLLYLRNGWYVTHAGLLRLSARKHCEGVHVEQVLEASAPDVNRWVFRAIVYKTGDSKGFVGYGDADSGNISEVVRGAEMRVAETRAVNRALRKAYGIGLCSVEELGALSVSAPSGRTCEQDANTPQNGLNNGQPRLRDKLCLLIRHFNLDANLVKAYAADFCGTETLRDANRELVESFITQIEKEARTSRDQLVCKLNSYSRSLEVQS